LCFGQTSWLSRVFQQQALRAGGRPGIYGRWQQADSQAVSTAGKAISAITCMTLTSIEAARALSHELWLMVDWWLSCYLSFTGHRTPVGASAVCERTLKYQTGVLRDAKWQHGQETAVVTDVIIRSTISAH
jgi:hypothetical protein